MEISWQGVSIAAVGFGAAAAVFIWGGDDGATIATALVTGVLGLLIPHPVRRAAPAEESGEE